MVSGKGTRGKLEEEEQREYRKRNIMILLPGRYMGCYGCGTRLAVTSDLCGRIITAGGDMTLRWILYFVTVHVEAAV